MICSSTFTIFSSTIWEKVVFRIIVHLHIQKKKPTKHWKSEEVRMFGGTIFIDKPESSDLSMNVDGHWNMTYDMNIHRGHVLSIACSYAFHPFPVSWSYFYSTYKDTVPLRCPLGRQRDENGQNWETHSKPVAALQSLLHFIVAF